MRQRNKCHRFFVDATGANFDPNWDVAWTLDDLRGMQADARSKRVRRDDCSAPTRSSGYLEARHDNQPTDARGPKPLAKAET